MAVAHGNGHALAVRTETATPDPRITERPSSDDRRFVPSCLPKLHDSIRATVDAPIPISAQVDTSDPVSMSRREEWKLFQCLRQQQSQALAIEATGIGSRQIRESAHGLAVEQRQPTELLKLSELDFLKGSFA